MFQRWKFKGAAGKIYNVQQTTTNKQTNKTVSDLVFKIVAYFPTKTHKSTASYFFT